ncbi:MAG TPA: hypothetical protein VI011_22570 [Asanoa sp.]
MKRVLIGLGLLLAAYLIVRAIIEPFVIDFSDPATYDKDWGGPHLAGVLAVHCGPGLLAAALIAWWWVRLRKRRTRRGSPPAPTTR